MDTLIWILIAVGVVLVVALIALAVYRRLQSQRLRRRFGPEYERAMDRTGGDRKQAESALGERVSRREQLELRPLSPAARETYLRRWELAQSEFVDEPGAAVEHAQALLDEVMAERGYPVREEFEERADLISVDHPDVVEHYREAHRLHEESRQAGDGAAATEERRQALVHYRALFTGLLEVEPADSASESPDSDEATGQRSAS
jgi:hypothetical protein